MKEHNLHDSLKKYIVEVFKINHDINSSDRPPLARRHQTKHVWLVVVVGESV